MANSKHKETLTFREIEYTIQMKDKDTGFNELYDLLRSELTRFEDTRTKKNNIENPIRNFLKTNIERSIVIRSNTRVYFLDYQEKGSFTIKFTILLITRYINYGTVRQALDYLIKDTIGDYFEELLERHVPVSITVHSTDNELYEIPATNLETEEIKTSPQRDYIAIGIASFALLFAFTIGLLWMFQKSPVNQAIKPAEEYRDKYFELLIETQVKAEFEKEKLIFTIQKEKDSIANMVQNNKFQNKK